MSLFCAKERQSTASRTTIRWKPRPKKRRRRDNFWSSTTTHPRQAKLARAISPKVLVRVTSDRWLVSPKMQSCWEITYGKLSKADSDSEADSYKSSTLGKSSRAVNGKPARVRTVLSEKQLSLLKSCYRINSRPDALVKEQLIEVTGLSPRVIRVWFQNKRCKDKKKSIEMKLQMQQETVRNRWKVREYFKLDEVKIHWKII